MVAAGAAAALGLVVGDDLGLVAHSSDQPVAVPARLVGTYAVDSGADALWHGDERLLNGVEDTGSYRTFGPFLTTANHLLLAPGISQLDLRWRAAGSFGGLLLDEAGPLRDRVEALPGRLQEAVGSGVFVRTGLPALLSDAERSLLVSRSEVLLLVAQLSILAAYAILLTATQLVDHRRIQTALIRSRGANVGQIVLLSLSEGLVIAIPVVVIAPWLAVQALNLLNIAGPLADAHLAIAPQVTSDGILAAAVAGILGVVLLALPPVLAARRFAAEQSGLSRQETRTFGQRVGLDVVLLAVAGIAIWQLRLYGARTTELVRGSLGLDPLLVAAPAIGLLAGEILTLRIFRCWRTVSRAPLCEVGASWPRLARASLRAPAIYAVGPPRHPRHVDGRVRPLVRRDVGGLPARSGPISGRGGHPGDAQWSGRWPAAMGAGRCIHEAAERRPGAARRAGQ